MDGRESPGGKTVRLSMEAKIKDYNNAGDMTKVNELLDMYPQNKVRPDISVEQAQHIATTSLQNLIDGLAA